MELTELNRTLSIELAQLKRDLEKSENSESIKMDMMRTQLFDKSKEGDDIKEQLNNALAKLEQFENPQVQTDNPLSDNYLTQIKHLENDIERLNHDSERFKRERDDKITNFEELNEAFKDTNFIIHQKDQEMSIMEEKIKELESKLNVSR